PSSTSASTTFMPSAAKRPAIARPIPLAAPVTTATCPSNRSMAKTVPKCRHEATETVALRRQFVEGVGRGAAGDQRAGFDEDVVAAGLGHCPIAFHRRHLVGQVIDDLTGRPVRKELQAGHEQSEAGELHLLAPMAPEVAARCAQHDTVDPAMMPVPNQLGDRS